MEHEIGQRYRTGSGEVGTLYQATGNALLVRLEGGGAISTTAQHAVKLTSAHLKVGDRVEANKGVGRISAIDTEADKWPYTVRGLDGAHELYNASELVKLGAGRKVDERIGVALVQKIWAVEAELEFLHTMRDLMLEQGADS